MLAKDLERFVISDNATIRDAMMAIDGNWREVVMVQDHTEAIVGVITDGDIRRGLLSGLVMNSLASEVMSRNFVSVAANVDRAAVLDQMKAIRIRHVPVLDEDRRLLSIHFLEEIIGATARPNAAVVFAGGKGTRLLPLTAACPKPMVLVAGRPILERIVLHLVGNGIRHIYLSIGYLGHVIEEYFGDGSAFGCRIEYLRESSELGSGGSLSLLPESILHPIIVLNGDQVARFDVPGMLARHLESGVTATISVGSYQHEVPFGVVHEHNNRLVRLDEKPTLTMLINRGAYILSPAALKLVPKNQFFPMTTLFEYLLERGDPVATYFSDDEWIDVGRPDDLLRANGIA
ncbi:MAG TPA: sugar phosphate nucleotidyltransferase [Burkholderiaceae bacterium]|jgi:dTDP-glucose pyrophosphorylase|nr:sugar phosphate nucleotidyltransferase [Burkholderiaceae bacterium]